MWLEVNKLKNVEKMVKKTMYRICHHNQKDMDNHTLNQMYFL